jgi:hypothetical protein
MDKSIQGFFKPLRSFLEIEKKTQDRYDAGHLKKNTACKISRNSGSPSQKISF